MPSSANRSHPSTRSSSPPATATSPNEVTNLLPPPAHSGHSSGAHSPAARSQAGSSFTFRQNRDREANAGHGRKGSVGGRSVSGRSMAGSVRGYGTIPRDRGPIDQVPRASKLGQRRILTTLPLRINFAILFFLTFLSAVLLVLLFVNTGVDLSVISLPFRGSGFAEFWIATVGLWIGLGGLLSFSHPSYLYFLTTLLTFVLLLPLFLLSFISRPLRHDHYPFLAIPLGLTAGVLFFTLLSNFLVRRAKRNESRRILRMLNTSAVPGEGTDEERTARALVGLQGGFWGRVVGGLRGTMGLIAGLAGMAVILLLLADMSISAYDASIPLPSQYSQLVQIQPAGALWPIDIHIACIPPAAGNSTSDIDAASVKSTKPVVVMYEPPSGVPGSLALLTEPIAPDGPDAVYPGQWLVRAQREGKLSKHATVCIWDRPGYGFSDVLPGADLGSIGLALTSALKAQGVAALEASIASSRKVEPDFILVGEGYGGLLTRVFASAHPSSMAGFVHIEAQTARTYFNENPRALSTFSLALHRFTTRLLPSVLSPLGLARIPSVLLRRSTSLSRILSPGRRGKTLSLNQNTVKARLQETYNSHSHTSGSWRALLRTQTGDKARRFPRDKPSVVISEKGHMERDEEWKEGQKGLAKQVIGDEGLKGWWVVDNEGKRGVCEGKNGDKCLEAVLEVMQ